MGTGRASHMVNVIDFGLAKKFRDNRTYHHIPYKQDGFHGVGTSLFAAINTHLGVGELIFPFCNLPSHHSPSPLESSRRDDLESLAYMLIYFLRGTLPWRKLRAPPNPPSPSPSPPPSDPASSRPSSPSRPKKPTPLAAEQPQTPYNPVSATWDLIRDAKLAHESQLTLGLPPEFDVFFRYARGLAFDDLPDYTGLRALFHGLAERAEIEYDGVFDWTMPSQGKANPRRSASDSGVAVGGGRRFCEACHARNNAGGVSGRR